MSYLLVIEHSSLSDRYRWPVRLAVLASIVMAVLSSLLLDGGQAARLTAIGLILFWLCAGTIIWRRPLSPSQFDLLLIGWGSWAIVFGFQILMHVVWHLRGLE